MGEDWLHNVEPMVHKSRIKVPYSWSVGDTGSRFLTEIRDHRKIFGKKCEACESVFVPPRKMCPRCFQDTGPWVEVGPRGTLNAFTALRYTSELHPDPAPPVYGIIQLDGSTTGLVHLLGEVEPAALRPGIRVEPVFRDQRKGHILDISHFRPVNS
jgi:uncharacterized OB-fold protein